jgi:hypothetical protein
LQVRVSGAEGEVDFAQDRMISVALPNAKVLKQARIAQSVLQADAIIDVPVLKTHDQTQVTLGIKNLKGCLCRADMRRSHALGVEQAIVDLCAYLRPALTVIDGTVAVEGMGPVGGNPIPMNVIIAGVFAAGTTVAFAQAPKGDDKKAAPATPATPAAAPAAKAGEHKGDMHKGDVHTSKAKSHRQAKAEGKAKSKKKSDDDE